MASFLNPAYWSDLDLLTISSPANPNLRWEKTYSTNFGLDFALFNSRIQGAVDVYNRFSEDLITNTRISEVNGFSTLPINFADVSKAIYDVKSNVPLQSLELFDIYQGDNIDSGKKSMAIGLTLQHPSRTLVDLEVNDYMSAILVKLEGEFNITLRE